MEPGAARRAMGGRSVRVAGIGCRAGAAPEALRAALRLAVARAGPIDLLATVPARVDQLTSLGLPIKAVSVQGIETETKSARIMVAYGTGSIAEAAALVAAGPGARLVLARQILAQGAVTVAVAEGEEE